MRLTVENARPAAIFQELLFARSLGPGLLAQREPRGGISVVRKCFLPYSPSQAGFLRCRPNPHRISKYLRLSGPFCSNKPPASCHIYLAGGAVPDTEETPLKIDADTRYHFTDSRL